jgi:peptide/nickel transport system substrate-binding protein
MSTTRRGWAALIVVVALALLFAACGDDEGATSTTAPPTTQPPATTTTAGTSTTAPTTTTTAPQALKPYGGEVIIGEDQEPPTLNQFAPGGDNFIVAKIAQGWNCGVQDVDGFTLEMIPDLVTELPTVANGGFTVNADGTETVRYQIREEAVWEDGTPISGEDFAFTYETIMDPDYPIAKGTYEDIIPESVVAGPKTFEFALAQPTVQAELIFGLILPKHQIEGTDFIGDYNDTGWLSCGPFKIDQWQKGEFVKLVRNENFWKTDPETGQQLPYLDAVVFRFIPETASLINAFKAREVDVINPPPSIAAIEDLQPLEAEGASVEVLSGQLWEHLNFQFGENRLGRNPESMNEFLLFRRAVAFAIDKQKIVDEILRGQVEPMSSYVDAYNPSVSSGAWDRYQHDPAQSCALVEQLCAEQDCGEDGRPHTVFTTTSNNDARVLLAELFVVMFDEACISYEAQLEDSSLFFGETQDFGRWDLGEWAWLGTPGFAGLVSWHDIMDPGLPPPDGQNYYRWGTLEVAGQTTEGYNQGASSVIDENTARYAELRVLMNGTVDESLLAGYIAEAEEILADQVVIIPLYQRLDPGAVWADTIGGYKHNPTSAGDTWNIESWYRKDL